jgi:wyosine [tRNA(Phe)-imidazoG37] synthetase (radical SAM superfamily)
MKHVYGPVPSRRLGQSLGIDPIPFKTCNWNCVYCQLGRTSPMTNQRRDYFPPDEIVAETMAAVRAHEPGQIDWITFVGSGEPTLHASLGAMIRRLKTLCSLPIAVITNGSLLYLPQVREELMGADAVLPTLDAGTDMLYRKINRPMPELDFHRFLDGLVSFRNEYSGKLWVEVMLVAGLNDSQQALEDLASALRRVRPDEVHLNSPDRPPCEPWVHPTDEAGLARAAHVLGGVCRVIRPARGEIDLSGFENLVDAIVAVITRHPVSEQDLVRTLHRWTPGHVQESLADLERSGKAQLVIRDGKRFWSCAEARYVPEELSRCHRGGSETQAAQASST